MFLKTKLQVDSRTNLRNFQSAEKFSLTVWPNLLTVIRNSKFEILLPCDTKTTFDRSHSPAQILSVRQSLKFPHYRAKADTLGDILNGRRIGISELADEEADQL